MSHAEDQPFGLGPFDDLLGLRIVTATAHSVIVEASVTERLLQPFGIVHGGVHCAIVETATSIGATLQVGDTDRVVGISNNTRFFRAVSDGTLTCHATPEADNDQVLLWKGMITDQTGRHVAEGLVNLFSLQQHQQFQSRNSP